MATSSARWGSPRRLAAAVTAALAALHTGLILAYLGARWLGGDRLWCVDAVGYIFPWLFVPSLLLLPLVLLLCRFRLLAIVAAVPPALFLLFYGPLYLPRLPVRTTGPAFTVLTYNVLHSNADIGALAASVEAHRPDFFGLRELAEPTARALEPRFAGRYPYHRVEPGCGFWSRYPILSYAAYQLVNGEGEWAQQFVLDVEGHAVNVFSVHPRSPPVYGFPLSELPARLPTALADEGRDADLRALLARLEGIEGPLVVIGDFNATDQQSLYAPLARRLHDAHRESGWGLGFTYARWPVEGPALWRIDYVFHTSEFVALSARVGEYGGSDHRPVIAQLAFR